MNAVGLVIFSRGDAYEEAYDPRPCPWCRTRVCRHRAAADIKFGMAGPITGPNAAFGAQLKNGVEQAVEDINAAGGILGNKIVLTYGDDVSDPKQASRSRTSSPAKASSS